MIFLPCGKSDRLHYFVILSEAKNLQTVRTNGIDTQSKKILRAKALKDDRGQGSCIAVIYLLLANVIFANASDIVLTYSDIFAQGQK